MPASKRLAAAILRANDPNRAGPIVTAAASARALPYSVDEDELLMRLKDQTTFSWSEIAVRFPERSAVSVQVRYSRGLHARSKPVADVRAFRAHFNIAANVLQQNLYFTRANGVHIRGFSSNVAGLPYGPTTVAAGAPQTAATVPAVVSSAAASQSAPKKQAKSTPIPVASSGSSSKAPGSGAVPTVAASAAPASGVLQGAQVPIQTGRRPSSRLAGRKPDAAVPSGSAPAPVAAVAAVATPKAPRAPKRKRKDEWTINSSDPALTHTAGIQYNPSYPPNLFHVNKRSRNHLWISDGPFGVQRVPDVTHRDLPAYDRLNAELKARTDTFPSKPAISAVREEKHANMKEEWKASKNPPKPVEEETPEPRFKRSEENAARFGEKPAPIPEEELEKSDLAAFLELPAEAHWGPEEILNRPGWFVKSRAERIPESQN